MALETNNQPPATEEAPKPTHKLSGAMIALTDEAQAELNRLREKRNDPELTLRVGVKGGGCAGLSYTLNFEESEVTEKDHVIPYGPVKLVVDRKSALFLRGMVLNYSDDLIGGGFKFENPNAKKSCSCGSSFSA
jgi:iron-sulfur cluster assembly accessory protein